MVNLTTCTSFAIETIKEATSNLIFNQNQITYWQKSDFSIVTETDYAVQNAIVNNISKHVEFSGFNVVSEEMKKFDRESEFTWIIDPIDGTLNYYRGQNTFAVSVALMKGEEVVIGIVYLPFEDITYYAIKGLGAYKNDRRLSVAENKDPGNCIFGVGFNSSCDLRKSQIQQFSKLAMSFGAIREIGSAAISLCKVASGEWDVYWETAVKVWDVAAGHLIVSEAGGHVSELSNAIEQPLILAANHCLFNTIMKYY